MPIFRQMYPAVSVYNNETIFMEEKFTYTDEDLFEPVNIVVGLYKIRDGEIILLYEYVIKDS